MCHSNRCSIRRPPWRRKATRMHNVCCRSVASSDPCWSEHAMTIEKIRDFFFELRYIIWFSMMFNQIILNMIRISGVSEYGCMVQISHHRGSREAWKTKNHSYVDHFWRYFDGQGQKLKSTVQNRQSTVQNPIPLISLILDGWDYNNRRPVLWHAQHQDPSSFQRETFAAASASPCQQSAVWPFSKG